MLNQEEEIFEKPTLSRSTTMYSKPPPLVRNNTKDTRMTIDELDTTLHTYSKPPLVRSDTLHNGNKLFGTTMDSQPHNIFGDSFSQPEKLQREVPSDYGIFDPNFEHDLYNWFSYCSNEKKAEYIKHLTDHMLFNNNTPENTLRRQETCIESHKPFDLVSQPRLGTRKSHTLDKVHNEPELESIFNSNNNGYISPPVLSRGVRPCPGQYTTINNSKSPINMTEHYSDDEFEENDPNEITMRHGDYNNVISDEVDKMDIVE